jgi:hypothetical protein
VLHDLHESVPYLYDNTIGDGPYNAWIDPILADEWNLISGRNVADMTKFGMPGVFAHGDFDTWSPGYLMFIAALHNGISRLYETFGNGGADTLERTLDPEEFARTWYKQNPPLPKVRWSQRDNNNYEETGLLVSLHYFNENKRMFLKNFYLKAKRSVEKPKSEGPAAYVLPADDPRATVQLADFRYDDCATTKEGEEAEGGREESGEKRRKEGRKTGAYDKNFSGGELCDSHGPTVLPHCRCSARLSILESGGSAEDSVRRHGLDVWRVVWRAGFPRDRRKDSRSADGSGEGVECCGRSERRGNGFRD